jgi:predicted nucleic acid-binding protein
MHSASGPAREAVETVLHGPCRMHLTAPLVLEYEEQFQKNRLLVGLSRDEITALVDLICAVGEKHPKTWFGAPLFVTDPGDTFVLETVLSTPATALVTRNTVDFTGSQQFLGARSWNVPLLTPREYLSQLR